MTDEVERIRRELAHHEASKLHGAIMVPAAEVHILLAYVEELNAQLELAQKSLLDTVRVNERYRAAADLTDQYTGGHPDVLISWREGWSLYDAFHPTERSRP